MKITLWNSYVFTLISAICLWFTVFGTTFYVSGIPFYFPILFSSIGFFFYVFKKEKPSLKPLFPFFCFFIACVVLSLISFIASPSKDYTIGYIITYLLKVYVFQFFSIYMIIYLIQKYRLCFTNVIYLVFVFQFALVCVQMSSPSFRDFYFSIINLHESWLYLVEMGHFRTTGLAGLSIYDTSIAYALLFLVVLSSIKKVDFVFFFILSISFVLVFLAGRTGLFLYFYFLVLFLLSSGSLNLFKIISFISIVLAVAFIFFYTPEVDSTIKFAFEFFFEGRSDSTDDLVSNHLFFPDEVGLLTGDFFWAQPSISTVFAYPYKTDSGFILAYIYGGALFSLAVVAYFIQIVFVYGKLVSMFVEHYVIFCLSILFGVLLFMFIFTKGPIYFSDRIVPSLMFMVYFLCYSRSVK